jgi:hypothetical protein
MMFARITSFKKSFDSRPATFRLLAPKTFLMQISLVRYCTEKLTNPRTLITARAIASIEEYKNPCWNCCSDL